MELNADFTQRVVVHAANMPWVDSPIQGVQRRMLDRIGDEVARATSIVKYDPGSKFSPHVHTGGEEFLVLEGVFQDEHGDFPAGSYIRNPPESRHTPGSAPGCIIFVKLWQFDPGDRTHVRIETENVNLKSSYARPDIKRAHLFEDARELVKIEYWPPNTSIDFQSDGGCEILVLEGDFKERTDTLDYLSWLRVPEGGSVNAKTGDLGAKVWRKDLSLRSPPF